MTNYKMLSESYFTQKYPYAEHWCVIEDSKWDRWIQSQGYPAWTWANCEHLIALQLMKNCSVSRTLGFPKAVEIDDKENLTSIGIFVRIDN